jgi:putative oxidoreductase
MKEVKRGDVGLLVLRIGLGLLMIFFGLQHIFGVFGGSGYSTTISNMNTNYGVHPVFANLAMAAELLGGIGILLGFVTALCAFAAACVWAVALYVNFMAPAAFGDLLNNRDVPRLLFPFGPFMAALSILFSGAGKISLDSKLFRSGK